MVRDIYNIDDKFNRSVLLCRRELSKWNYQSLMQYADFCLARQYKKTRVIKILSFLRQAANMAEGPLSTIDEDKLIHLLTKINGLDIAQITRNDYVIILRGYLKFTMRNKKKNFERIKDLLVKRRCDEVRQPKFLITKQHMPSILNATKNVEIKLICMLLHETAARIGEALNLQDTDISFEKNYAILNLDGKTGKRQVIVIEYLDALRKWVHLHPGGYLFTQNYASFKKHLDDIRKKTGLPELYAHLFRKSTTSYWLTIYPVQIVKKLLGHTPDSRALKHYDFVSQAQVNQIYLSGQLSRSLMRNSSALSRKYRRSPAFVPINPRFSAMRMRSAKS